MDCAPDGSDVSHFRDLVVRQPEMELVVAVYEASAAFPKSELYRLTSQVRRASVSIPSNIAEGPTRASTKEYLPHISVAQASLAEVETQAELAIRLEMGGCAGLQPILDHDATVVRHPTRRRI